MVTTSRSDLQQPTHRKNMSSRTQLMDGEDENQYNFAIRSPEVEGVPGAGHYSQVKKSPPEFGRGAD